MPDDASLHDARIRRLVIGLILVSVAVFAVVAYRSRERASLPLLVGVVHQTEIRMAPETSGRLISFQAKAGQQVRKGDILAVLGSPELAAALQEARAAATAARADQAHVLAGVRQEEVEISARQVSAAEANLVLARQQHTRAATLAASNFASKQQLDEATSALAKSEASLELARANYARDKAGPTPEERAIAAAQVTLADATVADLEAKLAKTTLAAPVDGAVSLQIAERGEAISPGQPVLTLAVGNERWFTFTVREDRLSGIAIGATLPLVTAKGERIETRVTEIRPLGEFAVWRAARAVGDHDTNSFLVRADPVGETQGLEPGMTVWITR